MKALVETTGKFALVSGRNLDNNIHPDRPSIVELDSFYEGRVQLGQVKILHAPVNPFWTDADVVKCIAEGASLEDIIERVNHPPGQPTPVEPAPIEPAPIKARRNSKRTST